jgi:tetratricopeptide (TPR) repeat protein
MKPSFKRNPVFCASLLLLGVILLAANAEAGDKKKKKKKNPPAPTPVTATEEAPANVLAPPTGAAREADRHLIAYDTVAAREVLESAATNDAWTATARGRLLEQTGDYEGATTELRRAADLDLRNPAPTLFLGDTYAYANKRSNADDAWAQAETRARGLLAAAPEDPEALYYLGVAQQRQKRFADAAVTLEKARSIRPDDSAILYQLGATRFYQEQFQTAFDLLSAALEKNSGIAYAYYYRGLAASKIDRKDVLFNDLDRFVKMAPKAPEAATANQILASFR